MRQCKSIRLTLGFGYTSEWSYCMDKIKILIVDDHPMMRDALKMAFTEEEDLQVIGEASDALKAIKLLEGLTPDVILMDLLMPKMSGVEAIARITANDPEAKILVLSSMEDEDYILTCLLYTSPSPRDS